MPMGEVNMNDSILQTVKVMLGYLTQEGETPDAEFDMPFITYVNSAMNTLTQLGYGPENGYEITGYTETWSDYLQSNKNFNMIKEYISLKVKQMYDPGNSSALTTQIEKRIAELEWRIRTETEV